MYTYDAGSNITTCKTYAYTEADTVTGTAKTTDTYTYGNSAWKDQLTEYRGHKIRYDAMGNPISYRGMTMEWEQGRKLKKITGNGVTQSHSYDADGCFWNIATGALIGAAISGGIELAAQLGEHMIFGSKVDFKSVAIATISGAVGGALAASGISESGQMIGNAVISSVTEVVSQVSAGNKNVKNIALNACAMGVLGGYVGKKGGDGVRKKGSAYEKNISTLKDLRKNPIYKSMKPKKYNRKVWRAKAKNKKLKKMVTIATTKFTVRWTWRTTGISHSRNWVKKIKEQFG